MECTTKRPIVQLAEVRLHILVLLSVLVLALLGRVPDGQAGWVTCRPRVVVVAVQGRWRGRHRRGSKKSGDHENGGWLYLSRTWHVPLLRGLVMGVLWYLGGRQGTPWVIGLPWMLWLWEATVIFWPWLRGQPEWRGIKWLLWQGQRLLMIVYLGLAMGSLLRLAWENVLHPFALGMSKGESTFLVLGAGCLVHGRGEPWVKVIQEEIDGSYTVTLCGSFSMQVSGDDPRRVRFLRLFLRQLEVAGPQRRGRRTRDGRTPFVTQEQLAAWFNMPQPDISREERYWLEADWPNLLSLNTVEVLTWDLVVRIVEVFATFPWWSVEKVWRYLQDQGLEVSRRQVREAARRSGWSQLRQELVRRYHLTAEGMRPREGWLASQLMAQVEVLLARLEAGEGLTPEEQVQVDDLRALASEVGVVSQPPFKALPWLMRVERVVFGHWEEVADGQVRCCYCGSTHVVRKSRKPRLKKYYDAEGSLQTVEVYRYYCRNKACSKGSFTDLPLGLVPHSRHRMEVHLLALQMYAWGHSTYRRTGQALGVTSMTAYRWVSDWGYELLPVAALFGVVKSSGVVGVDEKWVKVPKNDKPEGKHKKWMYVYLAVDVYSYDLLHIAIYPSNGKRQARAFLLALRAKGYKPRVIVTDLTQDYSEPLARVFPQAIHHECIFHALKWWHRQLAEVYGTDYAQKCPEGLALREALDRLFRVKTKRSAQRRYEMVLGWKDDYVAKRPEVTCVFESLERHFPKLVNAIESRHIPKTNNAVELVIRRFDQHYQNFCGFDSIETAQLYLGVFEKIYRFTPFSADARKEIRRRCPLELAGYEVQKLPIAQLCRGQSLDWPTETLQEVVPNG